MSQIRRLFDGAATELGILPLEAVANDQTVSLGAPFNGTALAQPAISAAATVSLGAPFGGATLHQPSLLATANIGMGKPFNNTLVTQPAVLLENPQTVILLNNKFTAVVWQPAVTPGAVDIALSLIGPTATVNEPGVAQGITLNAVAATTTVYEPVLENLDRTILLNMLVSSANVFAPIVQQPTAQTITLAELAATTTVHAPIVIDETLQTIALNTIVSGDIYLPLLNWTPLDQSDLLGGGKRRRRKTKEQEEYDRAEEQLAAEILRARQENRDPLPSQFELNESTNPLELAEVLAQKLATQPGVIKLSKEQMAEQIKMILFAMMMDE